MDFDVGFALGRSVGELDRVVAKLNDLIAEQLLAALLACCSHQALLSVLIVLFELGWREDRQLTWRHLH